MGRVRCTENAHSGNQWHIRKEYILAIFLGLPPVIVLYRDCGFSRSLRNKFVCVALERLKHFLVSWQMHHRRTPYSLNEYYEKPTKTNALNAVAAAAFSAREIFTSLKEYNMSRIACQMQQFKNYYTSFLRFAFS